MQQLHVTYSYYPGQLGSPSDYPPNKRLHCFLCRMFGINRAKRTGVQVTHSTLLGNITKSLYSHTTVASIMASWCKAELQFG